MYVAGQKYLQQITSTYDPSWHSNHVHIMPIFMMKTEDLVLVALAVEIRLRIRCAAAFSTIHWDCADGLLMCLINLQASLPATTATPSDY